MAEPYFGRLDQFLSRLELVLADGVNLETKHFFSGAAIYANGSICVSLSPAGFAIKLPPELRESLIKSGAAKEFRFFANGPIKRDYVALSETIVEDHEALGRLLGMSAGNVVGRPNPNASEGT